MFSYDPTVARNFIGGEFKDPATGKWMEVTSPNDGSVIGKVALSGSADVDAAVKVATVAQQAWARKTVKHRVQCLVRFHQLVEKHKNELAEIVVLEHGKTFAEAIGSINKGNETVEYAFSMPQLFGGRTLEVSTGVECKEVRNAMGVVASIVPFNFPVMVPMWTLPIAVACGNAYILKPSEKVPMTMNRVMGLLVEAGVPEGIVQIVHGAVDTVQAICDHPGISAVAFVGSSKVAEIVMKRCRMSGKRVLALGGAKNHLVTLPDCNLQMAAEDIMRSFCGCAGQRCMAASVLLTVGNQQPLLDAVVACASKVVPGSQAGCMGPVIDQMSLDKITGYIEEAVAGGAKLLLDGRKWANMPEKGFWIGPTIILHTNRKDRALHEEIFGPVLSVLQVESKEEAIEVENLNPYGNAACIYTSSGGSAQWFSTRFSAGMIGVNVGVPVPREPFSFGGINDSKFGDFDITGDGGIEFFTQRRKITTKWNPPSEQGWMS